MTEARFHVEVGRLVARSVERELRKGAHDAGVKINVDRQVGWIDGYLLCKVTGPAETIKRFLSDVERWINEHDS